MLYIILKRKKKKKPKPSSKEAIWNSVYTLWDFEIEIDEDFSPQTSCNILGIL